MRTRIALSCLAVLVGAAALGAEVWTSSLTWGRLTRDFRVFIPSGIDAGKPLPLVMVLHGGRGSAAQIEKHTGFSALAEKELFLAAYPQGYDKQWNDGRQAQSIKPQKLNIDDVGFISALIDAISEKYRVDPDRIYVTGISNGGFMSQRLACALSGRLAAAASVAAMMPAPLLADCRPSSKISILIMNGTEDPLVPYGGGKVRLGRIVRGEATSTNETVRFWTSHNNCRLYLSNRLDNDPKDSTSILQYFYKGVDEPGVEVRLYEIVGGGHTWPDASQYLPKAIVGRVSRELSATETIWEFFKGHSRVLAP